MRALVMLEGVLCPMSSMSSPSLVRFSDRVSVVDPVVVAVGDDCADNESLPPTNNRLAAWVLKVTGWLGYQTRHKIAMPNAPPPALPQPEISSG